MAYIDFNVSPTKKENKEKNNCDKCIHRCNFSQDYFRCSLTGNLYNTNINHKEPCINKNINKNINRKLVFAITYIKLTGELEWIGALSILDAEKEKTDKDVVSFWYNKVENEIKTENPSLKKLYLIPILIAESIDNSKIKPIGDFIDKQIVYDIINEINKNI